MDISSAVELPYGIHQVHLEANGYDSLTKYIQVGSEYAKISFTLEEQKEDDSNYPTISQNDIEDEEPDLLTDKDKRKSNTSISSNALPSVSENTIKSSNGNKVYIDSPKGVEVYLDSVYMGVSPVRFKKEVGRHTITLRKSGYKTKSYTIYLYNDKEDITYSFTDLEKEQGPSISDNTTSSGTTSDKTTSTDTTSSDTTSSGGTSGECAHVWNEGEITKEPTCTVAGEKTYTCTICQKTRTEDINPKGHEYAEKVEKDATCTEAGEKIYTCECGDKHTEEIPAKGHHFINGTCTDCGSSLSENSIGST